MISAMRMPAFLVATFILVASVASCADDGTAPPDDNAMHITLDDHDLTLTAGASGTVRVTVVRNAFDGLVTLRTEGVPSGVTVSDVLVTPDENEGIMVFTATIGASPGVSHITIRAVAEVDSISPSIRILRLTIRPPGSFSLTVDPISLVPGATASTTLSLHRTGGFTGTVTFTLAAPAGLVASMQPDELSGGASSSLITIAAAPSLRPGAYFLRVTASSPGFPDEAFDITVTVAGG
jgi:hypothetical protein